MKISYIQQVNQLLKKNSLYDSLVHVPNYLFSAVATKGLALISIPIFTHLLTPADYGVLNVFGAYTIIFASTLTLNTQSAIGRYYYEKKNEIGSFMFSVISIQVLLLILFFVLFNIFQEELALFLNIPDSTILFLIPCTLLIVITNWIIYLFKAQRKSRIIRTFTIYKGYFGLIVCIPLIYLYQDNRYMGKLWADIVVLVAVSFYAYRILWPLIEIKVKKAQLKYMFYYSIPLIPAYLSVIILSQFDRIMIYNYLGSASAGLYSFAYNLSMLQTLVATILYNAWIPDYYKYMYNKDHDKHDRDVVNLLKIMALSACCLISYADLLGKLLSAERYHSSIHLIPVIIMGLFVSSIIPTYQRHISFMKKTIWTSIIVLFSAILNIILNALFIPIFGVIAGAYTTLVSYIFQCIITYLIVKYILKTYTTSPAKLFDLIIIVGLCGTAYYYLILPGDGLKIILRTFLFGFCSFMIYRKLIFETYRKYLSNSL